MKQELIERYGLKFIGETKWNEIYGNDDFVLIWNRMTKLIKIKPIQKEELEP